MAMTQRSLISEPSATSASHALSQPVAPMRSLRPVPCPKAAPVLDLVHLSCQTFGDHELERDVLRLFADQARNSAVALGDSRSAPERARLFHLLKGSASGIGAFELMQAAGLAESQPDDEARLAAVQCAIGRAVERVALFLED
jgi:HPt (histidine-containing phosphotransfer) domain-containing protein